MSYNSAKGMCNLVAGIREDGEGERVLLGGGERAIGFLGADGNECDPLACECWKDLKIKVNINRKK